MYSNVLYWLSIDYYTVRINVEFMKWIKFADYGSDNARLLMQIHDEVVVEVHRRLMPTIAKQLINVMEKCFDDVMVLSVGLRVRIAIGSNWGAMHPLEI